MRRKSLLAGALAFAIAATGVGINVQSANAATTITIWHNLGTTQNAEAVKAQIWLLCGPACLHFNIRVIYKT